MKEMQNQNGEKLPAGPRQSSHVLSASMTSMMCLGGTYHSNRVACFFVLLSAISEYLYVYPQLQP